jgi:hypothetical protein
MNPRESAKVQKKRDRDERKAASLAKKAGKKVAKNLDHPDGRFLDPGSYDPPLTSEL